MLSVYESIPNDAVINLKTKTSNFAISSKLAFDRFAFVLLDAWRWGFLFSRAIQMNFLKIKGTIAFARIPTVTKPCFKSILSGSLPEFFELVENVDESGISASVQRIQDNLLARLHLKGKKNCLYGEDACSKLFPISMLYLSKVYYGLIVTGVLFEDF